MRKLSKRTIAFRAAATMGALALVFAIMAVWSEGALSGKLGGTAAILGITSFLLAMFTAIMADIGDW